MYQAPLYEAGSVVYLKESATIGFIESYIIGGVSRGQSGWVYTINVSVAHPTAPHFGERRSLVTGSVMVFKECEFIDHCDALMLAETYLTTRLSSIKAQIGAVCVMSNLESNQQQ